jgi:hypothetical protein
MKEKLLTVNFIVILISCLNNKFVTVYDNYVTILSTAKHFATCVSSVFLMHPLPFICTLCYSCNPTNKNLTNRRRGRAEQCMPDSNSYILITTQNLTHVHKNFFLTMTNTIMSQNTYLSS